MKIVGKSVVNTTELPTGQTQILFEDGSFIIVDLVVDSNDLARFIPIKDESKAKALEAEEDNDPEAEEDNDPEAEEDNDPEAEEDNGETLEDWTMAELEDMDREELIELIDDEDLDIDPEDYPKIKKLRAAVATELGIEEDED